MDRQSEKSKDFIFFNGMMFYSLLCQIFCDNFWHVYIYFLNRMVSQQPHMRAADMTNVSPILVYLEHLLSATNPNSDAHHLALFGPIRKVDLFGIRLNRGDWLYGPLSNLIYLQITWFGQRINREYPAMFLGAAYEHLSNAPFVRLLLASFWQLKENRT